MGLTPWEHNRDILLEIFRNCQEMANECRGILEKLKKIATFFSKMTKSYFFLDFPKCVDYRFKGVSEEF